MKKILSQNIFFLLIVFLNGILSYSQTEQIHFEHLTTEDGLSNNSVNAIVEDRNGFLWISTEKGLNRFDGSRFVNYYSNPSDTNSLCDNLIWNLYYDSKGMIWITTQNGLSLLNPETEKFTNFYNVKNDSTSLSYNAVLSVTEDHSGNIWIGTANGELNKFNEGSNTFTRIKVPKHGFAGYRPNYIVDLLTDREGKIWVGMYDGFSVFNPSTLEFTPIKSSEESNKFKGVFIRDLFEDSKGNIWIASRDRGFSKYNPKTKTFKHYGDNKLKGLNSNLAYHVLEDNQGKIWLGCYMDGLFILDPETDKIVSHKSDEFNETSLSHNSINSLFKDEAGIIWIGTYGYGINLFNPYQTSFEFYKYIPFKNSVHNSLIRNVHQDSNNDIWINSGKILQRFDIKTKQFTNYSISDEKNKIYSNYFKVYHNDSDGNLWIGSTDGIHFKYQNSTKFNLIKLNKDSNYQENSISAFFELGNVIWIGTEDGLFKINKKSKNHEKIVSSQKLTITHIQQLDINKDILLLGTNSGLFKYSISKKEFTIIPTETDDAIKINSIKYTGENNYWISANLGFIKYNSRFDKTYIYSPEFVNLSNLVCYFQYDDKTLFAGTSNGLFFYDKPNDSFKPVKLNTDKYFIAVLNMFKGPGNNIVIVSNDAIRIFNVKTFESDYCHINPTVTKSGFSILANIQLNSGKLFLGGDKFFIIYDPNNIQDVPPIQKIKITDLLVGNKRIIAGKKFDDRIILNDPIYKTETVELEYDEMPITINYSSDIFSKLSQHSYSFQLIGVDYRPSDNTKSTSVTYRIIPPGRYRFIVSCQNNNQTLKHISTEMELIVHPPFYLSEWFIIISVFVLMTILYFIFHIRMNYINKRNKELKSYNDQLYQEMTERKRAEIAVKESEKKYKSLFTSIADPILIFDKKTKAIIDCNKPAIDNFGYSYQELTSMKVFDLHPDHEIPKVNESLSNENNLGPNKYTYIKKDGSIIYVEVRSQYLIYKNKSAWLSIIRDETKARKSEQELERLNKSLELKNKELEQIIYVSSHDLRTPLVNIQGFSSEIEFELSRLKEVCTNKNDELEEILDNSLQESIKFIKENSIKMDLLLNGLLRFSRIGRDELNYELINTEFLVQSILSSLNSLFVNKDITIHIGVLPKCYGDSELIKQVFYPLIENAILYREPTRNAVIKIEGYEDENNSVFSIEDNGIGIAEAHQKIIFEIFHQLNPSVSKGVGLGLTFASKIVLAHHGEINVSSELSAGSKFTFSLPKNKQAN